MSGEMIVKVEIRSYWHAGTGRGRGALVDSLAHRDAAGLPVLPGRTVKGLLRDAVWRMERWGHAAAGTTDGLFGSVGFEKDVPRADTEPGALGFSDAALPEALRGWLETESPGYRDALFREVHATAIDEATGSARSGSLRGVEVAVPLTLESAVTVIRPDRLPPQWQETLTQAATLVRAVGSSRSRGLGRAVVTVEVRP